MSNDSASKIHYSKGRIVIFAHFDMHNMIDDYVVRYLRQLKEIAEHILFVSTSDLPEVEIEKIKGMCFKIIKRKNVGYDFMSWQAGIDAIDIGACDELLLCNDSVYGPLYSLKKVFAAMDERDCDFWGITASHQWAYHIQSYFVVLRRPVIESPVFRTFIAGLTDQKSKLDIISNYEIGLSQELIRNGFKARTYIEYTPSFWSKLKYLTPSRLIKYTKRLFLNPSGGKLTNLSINVTHFFWREIIAKKRMPFIKIELLRDNPKNINIADYDQFIRKFTDYDPTIIKKHLSRVTRNDSIPRHDNHET